MQQVTFNSVCAQGTIKNGLSLGQYSRGRHTQHPHQINWGIGNWMVGNGVEHYANVIQRQDFNRLSEGNEAIALYYTALGLLLGPGYHDIRGLTLGLPVDIYTDDEKAKRTMRNVGKFLRGEHSFMLDGEEITINVQSIAKCPQPVGAYTTFLYQQRQFPDGQMWAVADGGFNTLDVFAVAYIAGHPRVYHKYTAGTNLGMAEACRHFMQSFKQLTSRDITLQQADMYLREKKPEVTYIDHGTFDLTSIKNVALESLSSRVITFLRNQWGEPLPFAGLIFAGGEFEALGQHVVTKYPGAFVLDDPVMAIATGLYYQSTMVKSWKGGLVVGLDPGFGAIKAVTE